MAAALARATCIRAAVTTSEGSSSWWGGAALKAECFLAYLKAVDWFGLKWKQPIRVEKVSRNHGKILKRGVGRQNFLFI